MVIAKGNKRLPVTLDESRQQMFVDQAEQVLGSSNIIKVHETVSGYAVRVRFTNKEKIG